MKPFSDVLLALHQRLIVSCQAPDGDPFHDPESMARFARTAVMGGAGGIRANGAEDVRAIRAAVSVPILGIDKRLMEDGRILITPTFEGARSLVEAGAGIIALDCTARGRRYGAIERLQRIRAELRVPVMADCATLEEAKAAAAAGAEIVASTMRGYTDATADVTCFEPFYVAEWVRELDTPLIVEGHVSTPDEAAAAFAGGAFSLVIGTAITRPEAITRRIVQAIERQVRSGEHRFFLGIDLGATNTKYGVVARDGRLVASASVPTPSDGGREVLLAHLKRVAGLCRELATQEGVEPSALGVATAGWVDPGTGTVAYATDNLPGWTGAPIAAELGPVAGLPVGVENDANALAVAEKYFGAARGANDFVCVTLGTGVGGGCYVAGRLNRGPHFLANGIGHITLEYGGLPCTCGRRGCLEVYTNAAALLRYAGGGFASAEEVIREAGRGDGPARGAIRTLTGYLAAGLAGIIHVLDPSLLVIGGGLAENSPMLFDDLKAAFADEVTAWDHRRIEVCPSPLGYYGGVLGAAAVAIEKLA